ncbi:MAG TPA: VOC family protein [Tepidiformaceae bacterium]|nr:VOC family protein [Tepidiformaceae bacterium]
MFKGVDHVVLVVSDLDASMAHFANVYGIPATDIGEPPGAGFKNAFFRMGESDIELVSPTGDQGPVAKRLAASGEGVYLVALKVDNLQATVEDLRAKGVRLVGDPGPGNPITGQVFIHPSAAAGILTQLVER